MRKKENHRLTPQEKKNLGLGAILGNNPNFEGNFSLRCGSVRGTTRLPALLTCRPGTHFFSYNFA